MKLLVPKEVEQIAAILEGASYKAYIVGGCLRDLLLGVEPKDWDLTTNARPEKIQELFRTFNGANLEKPATVYENTFGTVGIKTGSANPTLAIVEVTTFRLEVGYTDKRHPDEVKFTDDITEDLARRDFTVNAMALPAHAGTPAAIIDPFDGRKDLKDGIIRTVHKPEDCFNEDALRLLRAIRFAAQLGFAIEAKTLTAIQALAGLLEFVSKERIRDEFEKLLMTSHATEGVELLLRLGLLKHILPELLEGVGVGQNKHHIYTVFEHNLRSLEYAVKKNFPLHLRLASLLHDVGKPRSKKGDGPDSTFYGHQVVGERLALRMLDRLHFPKKLTEAVALLVREHMFVYDPEVVTLAGVRRLLRRIGPENADDLIKLREADRIGSGVPKAQPYRLRHLQAMMEKVQRDPVSAKMLTLRGDDVMRLAGIAPGPRVGHILAVLLEEVLDLPDLNNADQLRARILELANLSDADLLQLAKQAKKKATEAQERIDSEIKDKYSVQ